MKIVIAGAGEVGSHLAKMLSRESNNISVIDNDIDRLGHVSSVADVAVFQGFPSSVRVLKDAGVQNADLFISVYPFEDQEVNLISAILAKNLGAKKVTARINDAEYLTPENKLLFKEMGIDLMFYPEKIAADEIVEQLRRSAPAETMDFAHGKLQVTVFRLEEDSPLLDLTLAEFSAKAQDEGLKFRIIAISRNDITIIPHIDTKFLYHDLVFAITKRDGMQRLMELFGAINVTINKVLILGGGSIAEMVAASLNKYVDSVSVIEPDKDRCFELAERLDDSIEVINGDGRDPDFLIENSIKDFDAMVALTPNDETNVLSCVMAKKFGVNKTLAEVENIEYIHLAEDLGVDTAINKKLITAGRIYKFTLSGRAKSVRYMSGTSAEILEYTVAKGSKITKGAIKDMGFPGDAIIGGVIRGSDSFIAVGDTTIEEFDRVVVFALPETVREVDSYFK